MGRSGSTAPATTAATTSGEPCRAKRARLSTAWPGVRIGGREVTSAEAQGAQQRAPLSGVPEPERGPAAPEEHQHEQPPRPAGPSLHHWSAADRKSTRLNSSHMSISYAVFCLKKK